MEENTPLPHISEEEEEEGGREGGREGGNTSLELCIGFGRSFRRWT